VFKDFYKLAKEKYTRKKFDSRGVLLDRSELYEYGLMLLLSNRSRIFFFFFFCRKFPVTISNEFMINFNTHMIISQH
jgi:hypothetical protein